MYWICKFTLYVKTHKPPPYNRQTLALWILNVISKHKILIDYTHKTRLLSTCHVTAVIWIHKDMNPTHIWRLLTNKVKICEKMWWVMRRYFLYFVFLLQLKTYLKLLYDNLNKVFIFAISKFQLFSSHKSTSTIPKCHKPSTITLSVYTTNG